jgi:hypothetical protein
MAFTSRQMLIFVAGAAVVLASLAFPDPIVGDLFYTGALLMIAIATIAAIYCRGTRRAYWVGFVILFAGYFCHTVWPTEIRTPYNSFRYGNAMGYGAQDLVTTRLFNYFFGSLHGSPTPMAMPGMAGMGTTRRTPGNVTMVQYVTFMTVAHTAVAALLGLLGGSIARRYAAQTIQQLKQTIEGISGELKV